MFTRGVQQFSQIDELGSIQLKGLDRSASRGGQSQDVLKLLIPSKVRLPLLVTWMKKLRALTGEGVSCVGFGVLVIVTSLTCEREILKRCGTSLAARDDVIKRERLR